MTDDPENPETVIIMREQAIKLMGLHVMLRDKDLSFRGYEQEDEEAAAALIEDVAQECALQMGALGEAY